MLLLNSATHSAGKTAKIVFREIFRFSLIYSLLKASGVNGNEAFGVNGNEHAKSSLFERLSLQLTFMWREVHEVDSKESCETIPMESFARRDCSLSSYEISAGCKSLYTLNKEKNAKRKFLHNNTTVNSKPNIFTTIS